MHFHNTVANKKISRITHHPDLIFGVQNHDWTNNLQTTRTSTLWYCYGGDRGVGGGDGEGGGDSDGDGGDSDGWW